jgi:UrcA family protein
MSIKTAVISARSVVGAAAVAGTLFVGNAAAANPEFTVAIQVSTKGLDLSQPAGARELYRRLQYAAWEVCQPDARVALEPVSDPKGCSEKALGDAIRSVKQPLLTQVYLETHTLGEAAAHGIKVPAQVAAK